MRKRGCVGLMLKHKDSRYEGLNPENQWLKWKTEPITIHAVLLYAEGTSGRQMGNPRHFTMAVWDGDLLVPITKVEVHFQKRNWMKFPCGSKKTPKNASVRSEVSIRNWFLNSPLKDFPVTRHKSGLTLRSPRLKSWKRDFEVLKAITLQELMAFF